MKNKTMKICIALAVIAFGVMAFDARLNIVKYDIYTKKVKAPLRIAFIADLHSCKYGEGQRELIDAVDEQSPDVVLFGGDIFDDNIPHENSALVLEDLVTKYPCYYVSGNHEYWSLEIENIKNKIRSYGVHVLEGQNRSLTIRGQVLNISGVDDPDVDQYAPYSQSFKEQLMTVGNQEKPFGYNVLLTHRPERIHSYLAFDYDLILSGHAHGGQWRVPFLLNGLFAPNQGLFPKYAGGRYHFDNTTFIVSRGLARESTRVPRIFNRPELVFIDLKVIDKD